MDVPHEPCWPRGAPSKRMTSDINVASSKAPSANELRAFWRDPANYAGGWKGRSEIAAGLIRVDESRICEIGCGPLFLFRQCLPRRIHYVAADLHAWTDEVLHCDLNRGELPAEALATSDVTVLLGVLEYVFDLDDVFSRLGRHCPSLVTSYCSTDAGGSRQPMWVNHLSLSELIGLVRRHHFLIENAVAYKSGQYVLRLQNLNTQRSR